MAVWMWWYSSAVMHAGGLSDFLSWSMGRLEAGEVLAFATW
jgi:hypothetical protein